MNSLRESHPLSGRMCCEEFYRSSFLISVNWLIYIWAVNNNHIIETSLGYYINPLVSVLLGIIVLNEKLSLWQIISFFLALIGVLNITLHLGVLSVDFAGVGSQLRLIRTVQKNAQPGGSHRNHAGNHDRFPFALLYLSHVHSSGAGAFGLNSPGVSGLLAGAGIVTAVPLVLFATGARRLPLSIVGFLQYIAPTIALILGVFLYHEPFTGVHLASFICIWTALTVFSLARTRSFAQLESVLLKRILVNGKERA